MVRRAAAQEVNPVDAGDIPQDPLGQRATLRDWLGQRDQAGFEEVLGALWRERALGYRAWVMLLNLRRQQPHSGDAEANIINLLDPNPGAVDRGHIAEQAALDVCAQMGYRREFIVELPEEIHGQLNDGVDVPGLFDQA